MSKRDGSKRRDRSTPFGLEEDRRMFVPLGMDQRGPDRSGRKRIEECSVPVGRGRLGVLGPTTVPVGRGSKSVPFRLEEEECSVEEDESVRDPKIVWG
jgi:hypothetical protein